MSQRKTTHIITSFKYFLLLVVFFSKFAYGQNYQKVDSIVNLYPDNFNSIEAFAEQIASDFNTDLEKIRAIYYWVSNNIRYNYREFDSNSSYRTFSYYDEEEFKEKLNKAQRKYAERTLRSKKGICEGYVQLIKFTCNELGLICEEVSGYTKTDIQEINRIPSESDHIWNAVKIDNEWKLIDATWSTGNERETPRQFNFTDTYFFIAPENIMLTHYPDDKKWHLLETPQTLEQFFALPIYYEPYYASGLVLNESTDGIIAVEKKDTITINVESFNPSKFYYYSFSEDEFISPLTITDGKISIPFEGHNEDALSIHLEEEVIVEFKIIVK